MYITIEPTSEDAYKKVQEKMPELRGLMKMAVDAGLEELSEGDQDAIVQLMRCTVADADPDGPEYVIKCRTSNDPKLLTKLPNVINRIELLWWGVYELGPAELTPLFDIEEWRLIGGVNGKNVNENSPKLQELGPKRPN